MDDVNRFRPLFETKLVFPDQRCLVQLAQKGFSYDTTRARCERLVKGGFAVQEGDSFKVTEEGSNFVQFSVLARRISSAAEGRRKPKFHTSEERAEALAALREDFTAGELRDWVQYQTAVKVRWSERNRRFNAGQDLMDANRGVYDLANLIQVVQEALAL